MTVGTSRVGSSYGPYTEYSRSVVVCIGPVRPTCRAYSVAASFVTAYRLFGSARSSSSGAWSLNPYSDELPVFTKRSTPWPAAASMRFTEASMFVRTQRVTSTCDE